ncbi:MAG TPA: rod shape-determining protein MreC [Candidatus Acidoferrales bacterium]|nr:rod shape-determining protein MreC [Candidatus Acidoferrales bacterium]
MLEFLRRNRVVLTSGSLLLISLLLLSAGARTRQRIDPVASLMREGMRPLQSAVTAAVDGVADTWRMYVALIGVKKENERLRWRILELEQQAVRLAEVEQTDKRLQELLNFRSTIDGSVQAAQIIGRDPQPWFGTVSINKGEADGIHKGMAVVSPFGVVGQTTATSAHTARVLLVTDHNSGIDAVVQRSRARGIVEGTLDSGCVMKYVKRGEDLDVGDRIVTSGLDGIFPKGITIGEVTHVTRGNRGLLQVAEVKPSVPMDRTEEVLVIGPGAHLKGEAP